MRPKDIVSLPFVKEGSPLNLWATNPTGDYETDNRTGRQFADALVEFMRDKQAPPLFGQVVKSIAERNIFGGIEVGFFHRIAERTIRP